MKPLRIVMTGESWHGSDCTGLARGFREAGHAVELLGTDQFFPAVGRSLAARGVRRALSPFYGSQFNAKVREAVRLRRPDFVLVFKGTALTPTTLDGIRRRGIWLCNFWPDVTTAGHSGLDERIFARFDHVFTTKSFGIADLERQYGVTNTSFLPHGFDPLVHRPLTTPPPRWDGSEAPAASFLGRWSPHKEACLAPLAEALGPGNLAVWGGAWDRVGSAALRRCLRGGPVFGDFYALAIGASRINLGLLSERCGSASSGDRITSRTFHIPASGGFLLHERTAELTDYYDEGPEVACFGSPDELVEKVRYYLDNEPERRRIAEAGHRRCVRENRWSQRARVIVRKFLADRPPAGRASAG